MKRIVNAHLTIPIEVDENGVINLLNEYTQTYITAFSGELKPRDNMYQKIMDFLKQSATNPATNLVETPATNLVETPATNPATTLVETPEEDPVYMVLKKSGLKVRKHHAANQTFKTYGNHISNQWTRRVK